MPTGPARHHLAQLNIARLRFARDAAQLRDYHAAVMPVARDWPGFLWIHDDSIIAPSAEAFGPRVAANLSLWTGIDSLEAFMTCAPHRRVMAQRDAWFEETPDATFVLWWIPAGRPPASRKPAPDWRCCAAWDRGRTPSTWKPAFRRRPEHECVLSKESLDRSRNVRDK